MVAAQVMGNDTTVSIAGASGHFQLNVFKPVMVHNVLESIQLLADSSVSFLDKCVVGIEANQKNITQNLNSSLMLVTALNQKIGYDNAAKIAKYAYVNDKTLLEASLELEMLTEKQFKEYIKPEEMISP